MIAHRIFSWIADFPDVYASQDLENIAFERLEMAPEYLRYDTDKCLTAYEEFSQEILDPKDGTAGKHLRQLIEKAAKECREGLTITSVMVIAVSRKAQA